ncbi:MAG TPA: chemotaxis protein CheW [Nitratidesulfovibrio sp.]|nr:chemotaxis protein CheW [Nitratidesulfovibrio sp.]
MQQGNHGQTPQGDTGGRSTAATPGTSGAPRGAGRPALSQGPGPVAFIRRLLALTLGDERFALDIGVVREVLDFGELTRIPRMPRYVRGVVNLRGAAVPVVDLRTRLGMGTVERTVHSRIVIVEVPVPAEAGGGITLVGALADAVREVIEIDAAVVEPPPRMGASVPADVLDGVFRHEGRHVLLLDADRLFDEDAPANAQQTQADARMPAHGARRDDAPVTASADMATRGGGGA